MNFANYVARNGRLALADRAAKRAAFFRQRDAAALRQSDESMRLNRGQLVSPLLLAFWHRAKARRDFGLLPLLLLSFSLPAVDAPPTYRHDGFAELVREEEPTLELHRTFTIPAGAWIRVNPQATIPVYSCDPEALTAAHQDLEKQPEEIRSDWAVRGHWFIVLPGGLGVFIESGAEPAYYRRVAHKLRNTLADRQDLVDLVGDGVPDAFTAALKGNP